MRISLGLDTPNALTIETSEMNVRLFAPATNPTPDTNSATSPAGSAGMLTASTGGVIVYTTVTGVVVVTDGSPSFGNSPLLATPLEYTSDRVPVTAPAGEEASGRFD